MNRFNYKSRNLGVLLGSLVILELWVDQCCSSVTPRNYRVNPGTFLVPQHPDADPYRNFVTATETIENPVPAVKSPKLRRAAILAAKSKPIKRRGYDDSYMGVPVLDYSLDDLEHLRRKRQASPQIQATDLPKLNGSVGITNESISLGTVESPKNSTVSSSTAATATATSTSAVTTASTTKKPAAVAPPPTTTAAPPAKKIKGGELYLPEDYNPLAIPKANIGKAYGLEIYLPLPCLIYMNILGVTEIDELSERITFDTDLTVEWVDGHLFDYTKLQKAGSVTKQQILKAQNILSPSFLKNIWRPDLVMEDLVKVEQPTITNHAVIGLKFNTLTGFISYTVRMTVTVNCQMSFEYYPADTQECEFQLKSYSYPSSEMTLDWLEGGVFLRDPSESNFDLKIEKVTKETLTPEFNNPLNDTFGALKFSIRARRKISYHLVQTYLPSIFHILITWLVFLIPATMYDLRVGTTMTTLLTLTAMFSSVRESAPVVNYVKAVDLWMITCVFFVFLNLVELTLLTWLRVTAEGIEQKLEKIENEGAERGKVEQLTPTTVHISKNFSVSKNRKRMERMLRAFNFMEDYSFFIFAILFVIFNICYWSWLMSSSGYFDWDPNSEHNPVEL